ncbi:hypothetical protein TB1_033067 [Malus domestica]
MAAAKLERWLGCWGWGSCRCNNMQSCGVEIAGGLLSEVRLGGGEGGRRRESEREMVSLVQRREEDGYDKEEEKSYRE